MVKKVVVDDVCCRGNKFLAGTDGLDCPHRHPRLRRMRQVHDYGGASAQFDKHTILERLEADVPREVISPVYK